MLGKYVGLSALFICASAAMAGPEWVEDEVGQGDAGSDPNGAHITRGIGSLHNIGGRVNSVGVRGEGEPEDFEDLYLVNIINANAFSASLAGFFGGSADFDARLYLFKVEGSIESGEVLEAFGVIANDDTRFQQPAPGGGGQPPDFRGDYKKDPPSDPSPAPPPQFSSGPTLRNVSTDGTNIQVTEGLHIIAVSYSPNDPFSNGSGLRGETGGNIFNFEDQFEVSGPDGPGGDGALAGWTRPAPREPGPDSGQFGFYNIALQGVGFAQPPVPPGLGGPADRGSATEKGSILFWSKVEVRWGTANNIVQDTFLEMTNDWLGATRIQLYFVNGDPPLLAAGGERAHTGWNWAGVEVDLTSDQPIYWSAATGRGASGIIDPTFPPWTILDPGLPPGRPANDGTGERMLRGFIVAWAVNSNDEELRWNHLAGTGTLVHYTNATAWSYQTWAFQAVDPAIAHGQPTGSPGILQLDGTEFSRPYAELLMNFQAVNSTAYSGPRLVRTDTDLTLHPVSVDLRQETQGPITTKAHFLTWNQNETKMSNQFRCITCWDQQLLSLYELPNHFFLNTLQTNCGKSRIDGIASQLCDLDLHGVGGPGTTPDGVIDFFSEPAALLGVKATFLTFDNGQAFEVSGTNLTGMGEEVAVIRADRVVAPPELHDADEPLSGDDPGSGGGKGKGGKN